MIGRAPHLIVNSNGTQPDLLEQIRRLALGSNPRLVDRGRVLDRQERLQDDLAAVARCLVAAAAAAGADLPHRHRAAWWRRRRWQQSAWPRMLSLRTSMQPVPTPTPPPLPSPLSPPPLLLPHSATLYGLQWVGSNGVRAVASDSLKVYLNHTGPRGSAARLDNTFCTRFMWLHLYTSDKMYTTLHGRCYTQYS